jgi:hypothetical protein
MVKAFAGAARLRIHPSCALANLAFWGAIAAGSQGRGVRGHPVDSLDLSGCRALTAADLLCLFETIGTIT